MPSTLHLHADRPGDVAQAAALLRAGQLVAFATETVYGLGAHALDPAAVGRIFAAKQRPAWDPVIVHLASVDQLALVTDIPAALAARVAQLAAAFWPGPLTLLLPRTKAVPDAVTAGRGLVGVRIPAHPAAQALLRAAAIPIAAPSANRFGHTSPTTAQHVLDDLAGRIDAVLDAGPTQLGLESTVLDPTQTPMVLYRPGAITPAQLTAATGVPVTVFSAASEQTGSSPSSLPSPGVGIRHYAPRARLQLTGATPEALSAALRETLQAMSTAKNATSKAKTTGVLLPLDWELPILQTTAVIQPWADWNSPEALAASLFACLRALDDRRVDTILCPLPAPGEPTAALRDRLEKAAMKS